MDTPKGKFRLNVPNIIVLVALAGGLLAACMIIPPNSLS